MKSTHLALIILIILSFGCQDQTKTNETSKISIVCTTGMLGDALKNIVDTNFQVQSLMGPGVDPHLYKATQGDVKLLTNADLIIYNGLHLEGKMGEIFEKLESQKTIIAASETISEDQLINNSDFKGAFDPHLWFDVELWSKVIKNISIALIDAYPMHSQSIEVKTNEYLSELRVLQKWTFDQIQSIDSNQRILITAHDAFGYFGKAYQMEVRGLQGISTISEYGLKDIRDLVDFISERKIKAVFVESSVSERSIKAVQEGCIAKGHELKIGGTLFSDAMGEVNTEEGTYVGMVRYNVETISDALKE